jgi:hypothetical protein
MNWGNPEGKAVCVLIVIWFIIKYKLKTIDHDNHNQLLIIIHIITWL